MLCQHGLHDRQFYSLLIQKPEIFSTFAIRFNPIKLNLNMTEKLIVFYNGKFMQEKNVQISPNDRGFVFGDGVYEVFRSYNGKLFYADEHIKRLQYSLSQLRIEINQMDQIIPVVHQLLEKNDLRKKEATIYVQITRGVYKRMHAFPDEKVDPTIFIRAREFTPNPYSFFKKGVKAITLEDFRWSRCDIKSVALLSNILSAQQAADCDAYESIFIRNGLLLEGSHTNVFAVMNGQLYTHPESNYILSGISREIVIHLCKKYNLSVIEEAIHEKQIPQVEELFLAGTSTEIMPVVYLNNADIGTGNVGPLTRRIQDYYRNFIEEYLERI